MRSGFVSLVGRPNVGKSSILNRIINKHIAITSNVAGTTRNLIEGIYNEPDYQIVFVDTPGIAKPLNKLGKVLNKQAYSLTKDVDLILLVVDIESGIGTGDKYLMDNILGNEIPVILVMNKIDNVSKEKLMSEINNYKDMPFSEIVPVSARDNDNIDHLIEVIKKYMKDDVKYYDDETITSSSLPFMAGEIVREKLLNSTTEEIPHSITCHCIKMEEHKNIVNISIDIIVDRDSIKGMIIGKKGDKLKTIGISAREDLENMFNKQVYLELYVKTIPNWKEKERYLKELGFFDYE